jgi:hypothetical protein
MSPLNSECHAGTGEVFAALSAKEKAYALYEKLRPEIPPGEEGWGAAGKLDLDLIRKMASACPQGAFVLPYTRCDKQGRVRGPNLGFTYK